MTTTSRQVFSYTKTYRFHPHIVPSKILWPLSPRCDLVLKPRSMTRVLSLLLGSQIYFPHFHKILVQTPLAHFKDKPLTFFFDRELPICIFLLIFTYFVVHLQYTDQGPTAHLEDKSRDNLLDISSKINSLLSFGLTCLSEDAESPFNFR